MDLDISNIWEKVTTTLKEVCGVDAIVFGGSWARETHNIDSDIDVGVYYDASILDHVVLNEGARILDSEHRVNLIAPPGAWVNGGGWLPCRLDFA